MGRRQKSAPSKGSPYPPQLVSAFHGTGTIRYLSNGVTAGAVTVQDLMQLVVVTTATTTNYELLDSIRIRSIEMWCPATAVGTSSLLSISEDSSTGGIANPSRTVSDMTMGTARPGHILWKPMPRSLISNWLNPSIANANVFTISCPSGTVMDVKYDFILGDGTFPPTAAPASGGGTAGQVSFRRFGIANGLALIPQAVSYLA